MCTIVQMLMQTLRQSVVRILVLLKPTYFCRRADALQICLHGFAAC